MYRPRTKGAKRDPVQQWQLPDRIFFAYGAWHISVATSLRIELVGLGSSGYSFTGWLPASPDQ